MVGYISEFSTHSLLTELYLLTAVLTGGVIFFSAILVYTLLALRRFTVNCNSESARTHSREKKKLLQMTTIRRTNDQGNRMLMIKASVHYILFTINSIQLFGQIITFVLPLTLMISSVKVGALSYNPYIISVGFDI